MKHPMFRLDVLSAQSIEIFFTAAENFKNNDSRSLALVEATRLLVNVFLCF